MAIASTGLSKAGTRAPRHQFVLAEMLQRASISKWTEVCCKGGVMFSGSPRVAPSRLMLSQCEHLEARLSWKLDDCAVDANPYCNLLVV